MSAALISLSPGTTNSSVLTLTPQPQDHGTNLTCLVTFSEAGVPVERTIQLQVTCECWIKKHGPEYKAGAPGDYVLVAWLITSLGNTQALSF